MTYTSDRPLVVDGVRLDSLAWNIEKINRATAGRRSGDVEVPGRDGVIPSLNDSLEPSMMGLEMFIQGTDSDGTVPPEGKRDKFWANLDELVHLFGKRHALLEVIEQTGPGVLVTNWAWHTSSTRWTNSGATLSLVAGWLRSTADTTGQKFLYWGWGGANKYAPALPGESWTVSLDVRGTANASTLYITPLSSSGEQISSPSTAIGGSTPGRVAYTTVMPEGTAFVAFAMAWSPAAVGDYVEVTDVVLERTPAAPTVPFTGSTPTDATYNYAWTGTPDASASTRTPKARRRAWAKVTDSIQPDMNDSGGSGKFTVGLELPYGVWEDEATADWTGTAGAASGTVQEVTTLQGATERITDAILLVLGPATNPRVTDPATGAYVELQADLTAADRWRVNVGTWATRTGNIGFTSADTAGTDQQAVTRYGGTANQAAFLPLTPVRLDGTRKVRVALSGTGFTASTQMQVRARRKYAL